MEWISELPSQVMAVGLVAIFGWLLYAVKVGVGWWKYRQLKGGHDKTHGMLAQQGQEIDQLKSFMNQAWDQVQQAPLAVEEFTAIAKSTGTDSLLKATLLAGHTRLSGQLSTHEKSNTPVSIVPGSEHASSLARKAIYPDCPECRTNEHVATRDVQTSAGSAFTDYSCLKCGNSFQGLTPL